MKESVMYEDVIVSSHPSTPIIWKGHENEAVMSYALHFAL